MRGQYTESNRFILKRPLNEKRPITAEMAVRIGKLCGNGPRFWANLQRAYDLARAERTVDVSRIPTLAAHPG